MSQKTLLRSLALIALTLSAACIPLVAQDTPSVAEAAKRARQQKQESTKPAKVITNDELPSSPAPAPATGETPWPVGEASSADAKKSTADTAEDEARKKAEIESLQKQISAMQHDIDTQKGAITLNEKTYDSDANRPRSSDLKNKIDQEKSDLERMQAALEDLKAKLEALGVELPAKPPALRESITSSTPPPQS